jgi:nitrogen fixation NifU-like protein
MYSATVMDHFSNPRNAGVMEDPDGVGEVGNPMCGDMMTFFIKVKDDTLVDVKFQTFGCVAAIAVSSMVSELAKGKTLDEAMQINANTVAKELQGLPKNKMHCSNLGDEALHKAIEDYRNKKAGNPVAVPASAGHEHDEAEHCACPYCEEEIADESLPYCQACKNPLVFCPECGKPMAKDAKTCENCGAKIKSST